MTRNDARQIVIVGAGQAAAQLIEALRAGGHCGPITLVGDEPRLPYQRPPLSKQYLAGGCDADWLAYRPDDFYVQHGVQTRLGRRALGIDRRAQRLRLDDGAELTYDALALATGTRVRRLPFAGADAPGLHYLRTVADADAIKATVARARRVVIVGGGFIGLEVAAVLAQLGREVTVLEAAPTLLPRVVAPEVSRFLLAQHESHGVRIAAGVQVAGIETRAAGPGSSGAAALAVLAADGAVFPADAVVVGVGVLPNVELAQDAGLECQDGIVVDELARTADPAIVSAGDCTRHPNALAGRSLRLETVHNAVEQAKTAAGTLCGRPVPYTQAPWVWSDQYGFRLQVVGLIEGYDAHVVRGDPTRSGFAVCYFRQGRFLGLHAVNRPAEFAAARRMLNAGVPLTAEQAADPRFELARQAQRPLRLEFTPPWAPRAPRVAAGGER